MQTVMELKTVEVKGTRDPEMMEAKGTGVVPKMGMQREQR